MTDSIILITHPTEQPRQFALKKWLITIGSMPGNDLVLSAEGVAGKHARLEQTAQGWTVVDMNSQTGTFIDVSRLLPDVPEAWFEDRQLKIGPYVLKWIGERDTKVPIYEEPLVTPKPEVVNITQAAGLTLKLTASSQEIKAGQHVEILLEIANESAGQLDIKLQIKGIPAEWVFMQPDTIRLAPQQRLKVPATIQPPRNSSATAGHHTYEFQAEPTQAIVRTAVARGHLNIAPFAQTFIAIEPLPLRHRKAGTISIHNEGNSPDEYHLQAVDADKELKFNLPEDRLALAAGQTGTTTITVRGKKRFLLLQQKVIPLELHVQSRGNKLVEKGQVIIPPLISLFLLLSVILPLLFLLFIFGGRYYICQDRITNSGEGLYNNLCGVEAVAGVDPTPTPQPQLEEVEATLEPTKAPTPTTAVEVIDPVEDPRITAEYFEIGRSVMDEPIMAAKLGVGVNPVLFVGGVHAGYAPSSVRLADDVILYLEENPSAIPENVTVWVISNLNPDSATVEGNGRINANGVDLNRNWQCKWDAVDGRGGPAQLSEPESQALSSFIDDRGPQAIIVWNLPVQAANQRAVSPGKCQVEQNESENLAQIYASGVNYAAKQANLGGSVTGDITDSLADHGLASVFVLLDNQTAVSIEDHMPTVIAVLESYN